MEFESAYGAGGDEVAVWSRALTASEVQQLYRRCSNQLQFQVRQCTSATCADNPSWQGPDGSSATTFSELDLGTGGTTFGLSPLNVYTTAAPALNVNVTTPYVQYKAFMQSNDPALQCNYNGRAVPCSPELTAASLYHVNYTTSTPPIALATGAAPYWSLSSLAQSLGAGTQ